MRTPLQRAESRNANQQVTAMGKETKNHAAQSSMSRRDILKTGAALAAASVAGATLNAATATSESVSARPLRTDAKTGRPPNLLLITPDQMRGDAMRCMGNPIIRTPCLDQLAANGALFTNACCQHPMCIPSRYSIMTGRYPHANGCKDNGQNMYTYLPHLPKLFGDAGYRTVAVGKMHIWPNMEDMYGFEKRVVAEDKALDMNDDYRKFLKTKGLEELSSSRLRQKHGNEANIGIASPIHEDDYVDSWCARRAIEEMTRSGDDRPWMLWLGFPSPHVPTDPPEPYASMYDPKAIALPTYHESEYDSRPEAQRKQIGRRRFFSNNNDTAVLKRFVAHYYGMITLLDRWVGKIVEALAASGQLENTLIIFGSDHGDYAGEHGTIFKDFSLFEGLVHTPFIVHWPGGGFRKGLKTDTPVENVDILPTFLRAAGIEVPWGVQGFDLAPVCRGEKEKVRDFNFAEYWYLKRIRMGDWKLVLYPGQDTGELYNLKEDPHEIVNRWADPACRSVRDDLGRRVVGFLVETENPGEPYFDGWKSGIGTAAGYINDARRGSY
jgi:arylsulfatase